MKTTAEKQTEKLNYLNKVANHHYHRAVNDSKHYNRDLFFIVIDYNNIIKIEKYEDKIELSYKNFDYEPIAHEVSQQLFAKHKPYESTTSIKKRRYNLEIIDEVKSYIKSLDIIISAANRNEINLKLRKFTL